MSKIGVVFFHSNIEKIYKQRWVNTSVYSILNQSYKDFHIYEINYNGDNHSVIPEGVPKKFWADKKKNYAEAMNFIITQAFDDGCDFVFNTNLDDFYHTDRFKKQLEMMDDGYDVLSTEFCYISEINENEDTIIRHMNIHRFSQNIKENLLSNHNVIAHPSVCFSKKYWDNESNRYDDSLVPIEDMELWKKSIVSNYKFGIHPELLLYYRIHNNQVSYK